MNNYEHLEKFVNITHKQYYIFGYTAPLDWHTTDDKLICTSRLLQQDGFLCQYLYRLQVNNKNELTTTDRKEAIEYTKQYILKNLYKPATKKTKKQTLTI
jgi:hypothetical protein